MKDESEKQSIHDLIETNKKKSKGKPTLEEKIDVNKKKLLSLDDLQSILNSSDSSGSYSFEIPSLDKEYTFKQLTVGQQRTISKHSANKEEIFEQTKVRLAIIKELCLDKTINPEDFTWPEFVYTLAQIRDNNFIDDLSFSLNCKANDCGGKFNYKINMGEIVGNLEKVVSEDKDITFDFKMGDNDIKFVLGYPKTKNFLSLIKTLREDESENNSILAYSYISKIFVNNAELENEILDDISTLVKTIDDTFSFNFNQFLTIVNEKFSEFVDVLQVETKCPKCGNEIRFNLDIEDFFTH